MTLVLDIHALQSLPPSNVNRDDTGAPKSAVFGGVPRQRVSSQSWKRAIRREFEATMGIESVGYRTKHAAGLIAKRIQEITKASGEDWSEERAAESARGLFASAGIKLTTVSKKVRATDPDQGDQEIVGDETGYLLFLSSRQIQRAAEALIAADGEKIAKKDAKELLDTGHSIDIAMFGRMLADVPDYNVDASVQVAHALGIHESEPEFDYFTAVDDVVEDREETGAGMIGTVQMMSSTLYRFATVDMTSLAENLGDPAAAVEAAIAFVQAFITSMPTGKQNTFANNTLPELVYLTVRDTRSISLVNAFEEPVRADDTSNRRLEGAKRLAGEAREVQEQYGFVPTSSFVLGLGQLREPFEELATVTTLPALADQLRSALQEGADS